MTKRIAFLQKQIEDHREEIRLISKVVEELNLNGNNIKHILVQDKPIVNLNLNLDELRQFVSEVEFRSIKTKEFSSYPDAKPYSGRPEFVKNIKLIESFKEFKFVIDTGKYSLWINITNLKKDNLDPYIGLSQQDYTKVIRYPKDIYTTSGVTTCECLYDNKVEIEEIMKGFIKGW